MWDMEMIKEGFVWLGIGGTVVTAIRGLYLFLKSFYNKFTKKGLINQRIVYLQALCLLKNPHKIDGFMRVKSAKGAWYVVVFASILSFLMLGFHFFDSNASQMFSVLFMVNFCMWCLFVFIVLSDIYNWAFIFYEFPNFRTTVSSNISRGLKRPAVNFNLSEEERGFLLYDPLDDPAENPLGDNSSLLVSPPRPMLPFFIRSKGGEKEDLLLFLLSRRKGLNLIHRA